MKAVILIIVLTLSSMAGYTQPIPRDSLYFGQKPPGKKPEIFAPGFISLEHRIEGRGSFSPDGNQFYFTVSDVHFHHQKIFFTTRKNNKWTKPDTAEFSRKHANWEPFFSDDGQRLYFTSDRNPDTSGNHKDFYYVTRKGKGWSKPVKVAEPINSRYTELFFDQTKSGNIYFSSGRPGGRGYTDIYKATKQQDGIYRVKNLGRPVNHWFYDWDPCVAPDESFMIITAVRLKRPFHKTDLYITFKKGDKWTRPKNLGKLINTKANEYGPFLSLDNKYLFFSRLGNGDKGDIYWVELSQFLH